jgi:glycerol-3-phosphate acyltransferase PlsX
MRPIRLAIDVKSGDNGSKVIINGIFEARRLIHDPFSTYLCGDAEKTRSLLKDIGVSEKEERGRLFIEHCSDTVMPGDIPSRVWKTKADAPIIRIVTLQKAGRVDASISAGDTGTLMGAALFILGRQKGALRPALAAFLPTTGKRKVLLLDVGANLNCRVDHLVAFGIMGYSYVKKYCSIRIPRLKLLNIGVEPTKGTKVLFEAGQKLEKQCKGYGGFIEGSGVLQGEADVVVCDGFTGNVLLKACESFHLLAKSVLTRNSKLMEEIHGSIDGVLNPENYGAVPFLGIQGIVLKAHGHSTARAVANAILTAVTSVRKNVLPGYMDSGAKGIQ